MNRRSFLRSTGLWTLALAASGCGSRSTSLSGHVLVVGAGMSGLTAAMLLEERGLDVTVVEARDRVGGRIHTLDNVLGKPEGGGPVISESYERVLKLAKAVGAELGPMGAYETETLLHVNGQNVRADAWAASSANILPDKERQLPPSYLLGSYTAQDNPLENASAWIESRHATLDISLADFLRSKGASDEALRLINVASNLNDVETTSALWALRNAQRRRDSKGGRLLTTVGGNSQLVERMAAAVQGPILLNAPVVAIRSLDDRVELNTADGRTLDGEFCVVTLPFSVLRSIEVTPAFQSLQKEAVEELPYTAISKYFLVPRAAFWEDDGLPVSMWTDTLIERVFPNRDESGAVVSLTCWVDGSSAIKLDEMSAEEQAETVLAELARIRPATTDMLDLVHSVSWGRDPWARGAYANYSPGQVTRLKPAMATPWQRLHFAGEHTAIESPGVESAAESAQRAARQIIAKYLG